MLLELKNTFSYLKALPNESTNFPIYDNGHACHMLNLKLLEDTNDGQTYHMHAFHSEPVIHMVKPTIASRGLLS